MINLKRQQVKALLDIVSKDSSRPAIENVKIQFVDDNLFLVGTDGYTMFMLEMDEEYNNLAGRTINRTEIERWYKLATAKDRLTEYIIADMQYSDETFPDIQSIVDNYTKGDGEPVNSITFNPDYAKRLSALFEVAGLKLKLNGKLGAMVFEAYGNGQTDNLGYGIIMPMKG